MATKFEDLPDEVLLIICEYLSQKRIIQAFFDLNYRLHCMTSQYFYSLFILNSDYEHDGSNRGLLKIIGPYLRSLTIKQTRLSIQEMKLASNIEELTFIDTVPDPIPSLPHLTDLNIIGGPEFQSINTIFSTLNQYHSVYISTNPLTIPLYSPPKYSMIKQLSIIIQSSKDYIRLLNVCPQLTALYIKLQDYDLNETFPIEEHSNLRIFSLRTPYKMSISFEQIKKLFQYLPKQLEQLSLEFETNDRVCLDGIIWENYFQEYFIKLNHFEFFMIFRYIDSSLISLFKLPEILTSFQSNFWSMITPQQITGYYNRFWYDTSMCIHTKSIPTVQRRRFFLY